MNIVVREHTLAIPRVEGRTGRAAALAYPMQEVAARIFEISAVRTIRHVMLTGATRRVGASFVARSLATTLAAGGHRILLIQVLDGAPAGLSLQPALIDGEVAPNQPIVQQISTEEMTALVSPGSLTFDRISGGLQERFDVVLWDLPPPGNMAPTAVATRRMDGTILVAESDRTTRRALNYATNRLRAHDARLLGVVLNRVRRRLPRWLDRLA